MAGEIDIDALSNGCHLFLIDKSIQDNIPETKAVLALSLWGIFSGISSLLGQLPLIDKTKKRRQVTLVVTTLCWSLATLLSVVFKTYPGLVLYCVSAGTFHGLNMILWYLQAFNQKPLKSLKPLF